VYVSGAVLAADLGLPDIGLTTLTEVSQRAGQIARVTDLPALVDADTGFGEPMNVARTVQLIEDAGLAGLHIEDQVNPKRCGHLDGKEVVDENTALKRIRAAVAGRRDPDFLIMARTDIRGVDGLSAAVDRAKKLVEGCAFDCSRRRLRFGVQGIPSGGVGVAGDHAKPGLLQRPGYGVGIGLPRREQAVRLGEHGRISHFSERTDQRTAEQCRQIEDKAGGRAAPAAPQGQGLGEDPQAGCA